MAKKGRPPKFVLDPNGRAISGLSYNKSSNCYYATYSKPRVWFSRDFKTSLIEFQKYNSNKSKEQPTVEIQVPFKSPIVHTNGQIDWSDIPDDPPVISAAYERCDLFIPLLELLFKIGNTLNIKLFCFGSQILSLHLLTRLLSDRFRIILEKNIDIPP